MWVQTFGSLLAGWGLEVELAWVPVSILHQIDNPVMDADLGEKVLLEFKRRMLVLGYNCQTGDTELLPVYMSLA